MSDSGALAIADAVRDGTLSATEVARRTLAEIESGDGDINSFTAVLRERALADAQAVDARVARGEDPGPLAGVPFAVKDLFDVAGEVTRAGSAISAGDPPAGRDAAAVMRLSEAGAVLVGTLNMDEYAYGFTNENAHRGPCRNPRDRTRVAGGSSGGSAAAVAAGFVPLALGSDTNGSVRVPAALCGVFGLKPTFGRIARAGMYPLSTSLDHVGVLAANVGDLAAAFAALDGAPAQAPTGASPPGIDDLRLAVGGGYFSCGGSPPALEAVAGVAAALDVAEQVTFPAVGRARASAMVITAVEGAAVHLEQLRARPGDFDPMTRDRFLAGALLPASEYLAAQQFREWFRARVDAVFAAVDVVLVPATPFSAPRIGQGAARIGGGEVPAQIQLGAYTQPLSFVGLPVLTVPVPTDDGLPLGVQLVGARGSEAALLRVAAHLEAIGLTSAAGCPTRPPRAVRSHGDEA